ncbi:formylmethanofuran dehydrogenase subunit A [Pedobacter sp. AK013]|uniref:HNH endonuclease n=1 Tax=Pedobacter sp. AK013 TaxID=2723071 RepID=UPI00179330BC|nr:HNH endonuclease [Pedobacter sp. AK013]MBB6236527.1 formylmethanofuran dehydrogenase subunit A [Pedobacter sp. AK013]
MEISNWLMLSIIIGIVITGGTMDLITRSKLKVDKIGMMDVYGLSDDEFDFEDVGCGGTKVNQTNRERVFKRDDYCCLKCGSGKDITIDHVKPKSLGGSNDFKNLQTLCKQCNVAKGATEVDYRKPED